MPIANHPSDEGSVASLQEHADRLALAWASYDRRDIDAAIRLATEACSLIPSSPDSLAALGWFLLENGHQEEAEKVLLWAIERAPDFGVAFWYLGLLRQRQKRLDEAKDSLTRALQLAPDLDGASAALAWVLHDMGNMADATIWARRALFLKSQPEHEELLGWLLLRQKHYREAADLLRSALSPQPDRAHLRGHLATALHALGHAEEALEVIREGLALTSGASDLLRQQIHLLLDLRRIKDARAACHRLLKLQPLEGMNWYLLSLVLVQDKRRGIATLALSRAQRLAPELPEPWHQTAWLALETGNQLTALKALERVLALAPEDPSSDILAAAVLDASGNLPAASAHAEKAVARAQRSAHAWRVLAQVRVHQHRQEEAKEALGTALDLDPINTGDTYRQLGWICFGERHNGEAIAAFTAAVDNNSQDASSWYGLAEAYRAEGKFVEALQAIKPALILREEWGDRQLRGQIIREQIYYFLNKKWNDLGGTPQPLVAPHSPVPFKISVVPKVMTASVPMVGGGYDYVVCSLSTQSHLPLMNTLAKSLQKHFSGKIYLLVVDSDDPRLIPEGTTLVRLSDVIEASVWQEMVGRYNILELCCALKSFLMRFLARTVGCPIVYLDADTYLLGPLDSLLPDRPDFSVFLTPHLLSPFSGERHADEIAMLSVGVYNAGMLGVGVGDDGIRFLNWWQDRVCRYAYDSREQGVFTDQKWLDWVPCFFRDVYVSHNPGLNVGHWRVCSARDFGEDPAGKLTFCGEPVTLIHMSGFKSNKPDLLAQHLRPSVVRNSPLGKFLQRYALEVIQNRP